MGSSVFCNLLGLFDYRKSIKRHLMADIIFSKEWSWM